MCSLGLPLHPISRTIRIFCFLLVFLDSSPNGEVGNSVILYHWGILLLCRTSDLNPSPEPCAFFWRQGLFPSLPGSPPPINSPGLSSRLLSSAEQEPWVVILQDMCSTFQTLCDQKRNRDKRGTFHFTVYSTPSLGVRAGTWRWERCLPTCSACFLLQPRTARVVPTIFCASLHQSPIKKIPYGIADRQTYKGMFSSIESPLPKWF